MIRPGRLPPGWKGIDQDVLAEAGVHDWGNGLVTIPYRRPDWTVQRVRYVDGDRSWWGKGEGLIPYGMEFLPPIGNRFASYCCVIVCEGESDTLACREALRHQEDARAVRYHALGSPGAAVWRPEWGALLESVGASYVIGDGDPAGAAFVRRVRASSWETLGIICPPGLDLRDVVQTKGRKALLEALDGCDKHAAYGRAIYDAFMESTSVDEFLLRHAAAIAATAREGEE